MAEKKVLVLNPVTGELQQQQVGDTVFGLAPNQVAATAAALATEVTARVATDAALLVETTARVAADTTLQANIDAEAAARALAVTTVQANVTAEAAARAAADATLTAALATEVTARTAADTGLDNRLTSAEGSIVTIQGQISNLDSTYATDLALTNAIDTESAARALADGSLQAELDLTQQKIGLNANGTLTDITLHGAASGASTIVGAINAIADALGGATGTAITNMEDQVAAVIASTGLALDGTINPNSILAGDATVQTAGGSYVNVGGFGSTIDQAIEDLDAALAAEAVARAAADTTLTTNLAAEVTARTNADATLTTNLAAEVTRATLAETTLQANITAEASTRATAVAGEASLRAAADSALQTELDGTQADLLTETTARVAADSALQSELDATQAGAGLGTNGVYTAPGVSNYLGLATSLKDADSKLDTQIKTVSDAVVTEAGARANADTTLQAAIDGINTTLGTLGSTYVNVSGDTMTGSLVMGSGTHITLPDAPSSATDAANKAYVDARVAGLTWKNSVVAAAGSNITLSGAQTIDGVSVVAGDRVLVMGQTTAADNGVYVAAAGAWARAEDFDSLTPIDEVNGAAVYVEAGTAYGSAGYTVTSVVATLGTSAITFTQFNGATGITAGTGLVKTGNTLNINLGAGIAELPSDEVGLDIYSGSALFLTVDGTAASTATGAQLSLKTGAGLSQSGGVLAIPAAAVTNAMLVNSSVTMTGSTGSKVVDLGTSFAILGNNTQGIVTSITGSDLTISAADASSTQKGVASFGSDFTVTTGNVVLSTSGVTAGSYGSATAIPTFTVDSKGRLTAAGSVTIDTSASATSVTTTGASVGDAVYVSASGAVTKAQANAASTTKVAGIVSETGKIVTAGVVGGLSGLTAGARYFLSETTAGALTATPPTTGYVAPVGIAVTATTLAIQIGMPIQL